MCHNHHFREQVKSCQQYLVVNAVYQLTFEEQEQKTCQPM